MPHVVGTAGHVDHGKSALVLALTGTDPDRLAEEKARGMTIDLGFAWTALPSGREIGFVDVPGHERFVSNMLAGVGGVDCALLVVDAAEGWRAQSAEHLAILDLLGVAGGVVALTKADLVEPARLEEVAADVTARLETTSLAGAPVVVTSARSGAGLEELRGVLDRVLDLLGEPPDRGRPRLPVDRAFTVRGSGTVVTGTLAGGQLRAETEGVLLPAGRKVRIRGLQAHGTTMAEAAPVRRLAVNLGAAGVADVRRGDVLALPGQWQTTTMADARIRCLPTAAAPLRGKGAYLLYAGAAETAVRLQPLDAAEMAPGEHALVRLHLAMPLVLDVFEPVVLRDSGRDETVAGGTVLDIAPPARAVRGTNARVRRTEELEARESGGRNGLPACVLAELGVVAFGALPRLTGLDHATVDARVAELVGSGSAVRSETLAWTRTAWDAARQAVLDHVRAFHRAQPLAPGPSRDAARSAGTPAAQRSGMAGAEVVGALLREGALVAEGPAVRLPGHRLELSDRDQAALARVEEQLSRTGIGVITEDELAAGDRPVRDLLVRQGRLVQLVPGLYIGSAALSQAEELLRAAFAGRDFTAGEAREALGTTRRTAIPLLEHLDRRGVTLRQGDRRRVRGDGAPAAMAEEVSP